MRSSSIKGWAKNSSNVIRLLGSLCKSLRVKSLHSFDMSKPGGIWKWEHQKFIRESPSGIHHKKKQDAGPVERLQKHFVIHCYSNKILALFDTFPLTTIGLFSFIFSANSASVSDAHGAWPNKLSSDRSENNNF